MARHDELSESDVEIVLRVPRDESRALLASRLNDAIEAKELAELAWRDHERRYGAELDQVIQEALHRAGIKLFRKF